MEKRSTPPLGLKVWSTNECYFPAIRELWRESVMDYIEIYALPNTAKEMSPKWQQIHKDLSIPMVIHAPHDSHGMCLSRHSYKSNNQTLIEESLRFADAVDAKIVIVHAGVNGTIEETARQLRLFRDDRLVLENQPRYGHGENLICNGALPEEIAFVMTETRLGFCLDIGHAITAANGFDMSPWKILSEFLALRPILLHVTDGHWNSRLDEHLHFGEGDFPLFEIMETIAAHDLGHLPITNEAHKRSPTSLDDFREDMAYLRKMYSSLPLHSHP